MEIVVLFGCPEAKQLEAKIKGLSQTREASFNFR
jgi:hypothetical protein